MMELELAMSLTGVPGRDLPTLEMIKGDVLMGIWLGGFGLILIYSSGEFGSLGGQ